MDDLHTPNPEAAATWQRHNAVDTSLPPEYGITADDVPPPKEGRPHPPDCWHCRWLKEGL